MSCSCCSNCKYAINNTDKPKKKDCPFACNGANLCVEYLLAKEFDKYAETVVAHNCIKFPYFYLNIIRNCPTFELFVQIFEYLGTDKLMYRGEEFSFLTQTMMTGKLDICKYIYNLDPSQLTKYDSNRMNPPIFYALLHCEILKYFCTIDSSLVKILTDMLYSLNIEKLYMFNKLDSILWLEQYTNEHLGELYDMDKFKIIFVLLKNNLLETVLSRDYKKDKNISKDELLLLFKKRYNETHDQYNTVEKKYKKYKNVQSELDLIIE